MDCDMSSIAAGTTLTTALVATGDTAGNLVLKTNGTTTALTIGTDQVVTLAQPLPVASGGTGTTSTTFANLATNVTGTLPIANGGTGTTSTTFANLATNVTGTLPVANGGTGFTNATAYAVLCGGTTSTGAFQSITSVGTSGQVLTSNGAGALPTFQTSSGISTGKAIAMAIVFGG